METRLQEALKDLCSAHFIIELLRNEVSIGTESTGKQCDSGIVKKKNIELDPPENSHVKTKWSDAVAGRSIGRRKEDCTSNRILESNITSPSTENQWKTVNRGHKNPPTLSHILYYQIPVILSRYEALRNGRKDEQMARKPVKADELEMRNEDREKIQKK